MYPISLPKVWGAGFPPPATNLSLASSRKGRAAGEGQSDHMYPISPLWGCRACSLPSDSARPIVPAGDLRAGARARPSNNMFPISPLHT